MKLMNGIRLTALVSLLGLAIFPARAQETNQIDQLKQQLDEMRESFERVQREQKAQIDALTKQLDQLTKQQAAEAEKKKLEQEMATALQTNQPPSSQPAV